MAKCLALSVDRSVVSLRPDLMKYWDHEQNAVDPSELPTSSRKSVHWRCPDNPDHKWMALIKNMVKDCKCPGCVAGTDRRGPTRKPPYEKLLSTIDENVSHEWHVPYNGDITPNDVSASSPLRFWWKCSKHGVIWEASVYDRTDGKGCPLCRGEKISKARSTLKPGDSLADKYPDLTMEWNIFLNSTTPDKVFAHGRDIVHWICINPDCRYQWASPVYNRTCNGSGCPECATRATAERERIPAPGHSLLEMYPKIASELVRSEYGETDPANIAYSSGAMCTWKCSVCNETVWDASANSRTAKKKDIPGCSRCSATRVGKANSKPRNGIYLKDGAKELADEWDEKRNREKLGLELCDMALHSNKDAYWICPNCGESYLLTINKRTSRGDGCTRCDYHAKASFPEKALLYYVSAIFEDAVGNASPEIEGLGRKEFDVWIPSIRAAVEYDGQGWHTNAERDAIKDEICHANNIKLIRIRETNCPEYKSSPSTVIIDRNPNAGYSSLDDAIRKALEELGCAASVNVDSMGDEGSIRAEMRLEFISNSIAETHPEIANLWCYEKNGDMKPEMFTAGSTREVYWNCAHGHDPYVQRILNRVKAAYNGCPGCNSERLSKRMSKPKPGESLYDVYPDIAKTWDEEANGDLTPRDVKPHSGIEVYWRCENHDEPYLMKISHRTRGCGCPYCCTPARKVLPGFNDLATVHPELVDEWDDDANGDRTPYNTLSGSHYEAYWICSYSECGWKWKASVSSRARGNGCPKCKGMKITIAKMRPDEGQSLLDLYPDIASEWSDENGLLTPSTVKPTSQKIVKWECSFCDEVWEQSICDRVSEGGRGCGNCVGR